MHGKQFSHFKIFFLLVIKCSGTFYGEVEIAPSEAIIIKVPENSCLQFCEVVFYKPLLENNAVGNPNS